MRQVLSLIGGVGVMALLVRLKYLDIKRQNSRDLGDGGIQKLFSNDR